MKKKIEIIALILFAIITVFGIMYIYNTMSQFGYNKIGEQALNIAKLTSAALEITDKDVEELLSLEFDELANNKLNKQLEDFYVKANLSDNVEYVYVLFQLKDEDVKYTVDTPELAEFYGVEIGDKLDYVWLLDYIVNEKVRAEANSREDYYDDIYRYTTIDEETRMHYKNRDYTFFVSEDEWDKTITGYVPLYTVEGTYIGLLGVDIFATDYYEYRDGVFKLGLLIFVLLVTLLIIILSFRYVSDRTELQIDMLSGLYRRRFYEKYAVKVMKGLKTKDDSVTVIMLDIDEFKRYNDFYGHMRGDIVISSVCKIIKEAAEIHGGKAGRFGGEEFIIIAPNISIEDGDMLCEKIRKDVEQLNIAHENGVANRVITISVGATTVHGGNKKMAFEQVVELADVGLYNAKHNGRNRFVRHQSKPL